MTVLRTFRWVPWAAVFAVLVGAASVRAQRPFVLGPDIPVTAPAAPTVPEVDLPEASATFDVPLSTLTAAWPVVGGKLAGVGKVACGWTAKNDGVHRTCTVTSDKALLEGSPLGLFQGSLETPPRGPSQVKVSVRGAAVEHLEVTFEANLSVDVRNATVAWSDDALNVQVDAKGLDTALLTRLMPALSLDGRVDLALTLTGTRKAPKIDAKWTASALSWRGIPALPTEGTWQHEGDVSHVVFVWGAAPGPLVNVDARMPIALDLSEGATRTTWLDTKDHAVKVVGTGLNARFVKPFMELPRGVTAKLDFAADASGSLDALVLDAKLAGTVALTPTLTVPVDITLASKAATQQLKFALGTLVTADVAMKVNWQAIHRETQSFSDVAVEGAFHVDAGLDEIAAYLPEAVASPVGRLKGDVKVAGTAGSPLFDGRITAHGAAMTLTDLNQRLDPIQLSLVWKGPAVNVETLRGQAGNGSVVGTGGYTIKRYVPAPSDATASKTWAGWDITGGVELKLKDFPVVQQSLPLGTLNANLKVHVAETPPMFEVALVWSKAQVRFTEQELPEAGAIPANRNVRILDWLGETANRNDLFGKPDQAARLTITLADPIDVRGAKFSMKLEGAMDVIRRGSIVTVDGGFDARKGGQFQLFDNPFTVRSGRLSLVPGHLERPDASHHFDGIESEGDATETTVTVELQDPDRPVEGRPLDAVVDFTAEGDIEDTLVVVQVRGPATRPELVLVSNPPLPEYQIVTLLITGRVDAVDETNGQVRRQVALLAERFHNPSLQRQLFDRIGIDRIGIGFGDSVSEPILTVGKQLSRRVYVETIYHHNAPPEENTTAGRMQYRLDPWWTVDTTVGDAGNGNLGVFWATHFGGPPPPGPEALAKLGTKPPADRDGDGLADPVDQCLDEPEDKDDFEDSDGCPDPDNDGDSIADAQDQRPLDPETKNGFEDDDGAPDTAPDAVTNLAVQVDAFSFRAGSASPRPNGPAVRALLGLLREFRETTFDIVGHADDPGPPEANMWLSRRRAEAAKELLVAKGVNKFRLRAMGRGIEEKIDPATTTEARARNRRVEFREVAGNPGPPVNGARTYNFGDDNVTDDATASPPAAPVPPAP